MPHTPNSSGPFFGRDTAVENGIATTEANLEAGNRTEADAIELLLVLARKKKQILQITLVATLLAAIVSFLLPKMYTATATILPPERRQSTLSSILGQLGALSGAAGRELGLKNPGDLCVAMLKSRTIEDRLVNRFDLRKVYWVKRYEDARKKLEKRSDIIATDEGLVSIAVKDRDPNRAADIANAYVEELRLLNEKVAVTEAAQRRLFYQLKVDTEREALSEAETSLQRVEEKGGLLQPEAQGKAIIEAVADMRAQVAIHEVQVQAMRTYATQNNPDLKRAEQELGALRSQLAKLERDTGELGNGNLEVPTRKLPEVQLEYQRRLRDLKYHEALYEFLGKQLEAARIDEGKDVSVVQVIDKAVAPEKKSSPKRVFIIGATALIALALSCLGVILIESLRRRQQYPDERARLALLWQSLKFPSGNS